MSPFLRCVNLLLKGRNVRWVHERIMMLRVSIFQYQLLIGLVSHFPYQLPLVGQFSLSVTYPITLMTTGPATNSIKSITPKMGNCASAKRKEYEFLGDPQPQNVEAWNHPSAPPIPFEIRLSNAKLKNVPYEYASVVINIPGCIETKLERKKGPNNIKWTFDSQARVRLTEYELRKKFVVISVFQAVGTEVKVAELKLNLFLIATGPYHQDFPIRYTNKAQGRVSLDVRISEVVDLRIESLHASATLLEDRRNQLFKYTLKLVSSTFKHAQSEGSYSEKLAAISTKKMEEAFRKTKTRASVHEEMHGALVWSKEGAEKNKNPLPIVGNSMLGSDIPNACMQFLLWVVRGQATHEEQAPSVMLVGQCYVSFNKLLNSQPTLKTINGRQHEVHSIDVKEKMWYHGKYIGDLQLDVSIDVPRFYKQMIVYVRTEMGTMKNSPVIITDERSRADCQELQQLVLSKDSIQLQMNELAALEQINNKNPKARQMRVRIQLELKKQLEKLETSRKESTMMYSYRSEEEIVKAQEVFIDIGYRLLTFVEEEDSGFRDIAFQCLMALIKRSELALAYMGFKPEEKEALKHSSHSKYISQKLQIAIKFQAFLYQILRNVLTFLNQKALQENERMFVELFTAYSYFRVPQFRESLLSILVKPDDPEITEWRGTEFSLTEDHKLDRKQSNTFSLLFDWQSNFYDVISGDQRCRQNLNELSQIISKEQWQHRMQKRGIGFFFFIIYWIKYVEKIAILTDNVRWQDLPGYPQLLRAVLCEMKRRPIVDYPDTLIEATVSMLANQKLLNTFITVLFNKTNIFDSNTTLRTIELVSRYFSELDKTKRSIPTSFNYNFFMSGLKNIIMSDHSYAIAKCLLLYYDHYNMLNYLVRKDLNMFLMGRAYFRLFLSWSLNVRTIFHHLVVFRIYLQSNIQKKERDSMGQQEFLDSEQLKNRYSLLISILENAKDRKQEDQNMKFGYNYEKEYYKKMKKKLQDQKRIGNKNPHVHLISQKSPDRNAKYKLVELVKAPNSRARSEALNVKVNYDKPPSSQTDLSNVIVKYQSDKAQEESKDRSVSQSRSLLKRLTSHQSDYEIAQIDPRAVQYISRALVEFRDAEDKYEKFFSKNGVKDPVPAVVVKVPIDEIELRPFHIDEW